MKRIAVVLSSYLLFTMAHAASFDCAKAKSPFEKIVCSNPKISSYDEDLNKAYGAAMKLLSPNGQAILKRGQIDWLRYINSVCIKHNDPNDKFQTPAFCVKQKYIERIKDLKYAALRVGPYLFSRIDYFYFNKVDSNGRPYDRQTSYPRIDSPVSESTKKWNAMIIKGSFAMGDDACDGSPGDENVSFKIRSANEKYISVTTSDWLYCHGTPHGMGGSKGVTFAMQPDPHLLTTKDLFGKKDKWKVYVTDKCVAALQSKAGNTEVDRDNVARIAASTEAWSLTNDGLEITFNPNEVLSYAAGTTNVVIPWKDLQPFLISNTLIPGP